MNDLLTISNAQPNMKQNGNKHSNFSQIPTLHIVAQLSHPDTQVDLVCCPEIVSKSKWRNESWARPSGLSRSWRDAGGRLVLGCQISI
jgi:hypothetical protein